MSTYSITWTNYAIISYCPSNHWLCGYIYTSKLGRSRKCPWWLVISSFYQAHRNQLWRKRETNQDCVLSAPSGAWHPHFVPEWLSNLSFFHTNHKQGTLGFTGSEHHWVLFCMPFPALLQLLFLLIAQVCCDILFVTMLIKLLYCVNFNFILNVTFN